MKGDRTSSSAKRGGGKEKFVWRRLGYLTPKNKPKLAKRRKKWKNAKKKRKLNYYWEERRWTTGFVSAERRRSGALQIEKGVKGKTKNETDGVGEPGLGGKKTGGPMKG